MFIVYSIPQNLLTPEELEFKKNKKRVDHDLPIVLNTSQNEHTQNNLNLNADEQNSDSQSRDLQRTRNVSPLVQHSMNSAAAGIGAPFNIESLIHSNYQTNNLSESAAVYSMYNTHNG